MPKYPSVKNLNGIIRIPGFFSEESFCEALQYKAKPGQLFLSTFPKCGTTWSQHIVLLIQRKGEPFDSVYMHTNSPFLEMTGPGPIDKMQKGTGMIKTHLPYHLMPQHPEAKYICVARNPKDTCVSFFHHCRNFPGYNFKDGQFEDFFEFFMDGETEWDDYMDHVLGWYKHKDDPNVLFITYEEIKMDTANSLKRIAKFMGEEHAIAMEDPEVLKKVMYHCSVDFMKKNYDKQTNDFFCLPMEVLQKDPNITPGQKVALHGLWICPGEGERSFNFVRKGVIGDWKSFFTAEQSRRMNERFREKMAGTDLEELFESSGCFDDM